MNEIEVETRIKYRVWKSITNEIENTIKMMGSFHSGDFRRGTVDLQIKLGFKIEGLLNALKVLDEDRFDKYIDQNGFREPYEESINYQSEIFGDGRSIIQKLMDEEVV